VVFRALGRRHRAEHAAGLEPAAPIEARKVRGVALGQVIVGRQDMQGQLGPAERHRRQCDGERLAFAGGHFRHGAVEQGERAAELDGVGIEPEFAARQFGHHGKGCGRGGQTIMPVAADLEPVAGNERFELRIGNCGQRCVLGTEAGRLGRKIGPGETPALSPADRAVHQAIQPAVERRWWHEARADDFGGRGHDWR
jgi:hypothetical protein